MPRYGPPADGGGGGGGTLIERLHVSAALVLHAMVGHGKTSGPGSGEAV